MTPPRIAFGYAITSVAVDSGVQRNVSNVPTGCTAPKWAITTGVEIRNVATPAAIARDVNSPAIWTITDDPWSPRSFGIQSSHRVRTAGATCRSASTQPKLS